MEFKDFVKNRHRMCANFKSCDDCPMYGKTSTCAAYPFVDPESAEAILQKWIDEHPLRTNSDMLYEITGIRFNIQDKHIYALYDITTNDNTTKFKNWLEQEAIDG